MYVKYISFQSKNCRFFNCSSELEWKCGEMKGAIHDPFQIGKHYLHHGRVSFSTYLFDICGSRGLVFRLYKMYCFK